MREYKTVTVEKLKINKVYCNCCGQEIKTNKHGITEEHITIKKRWGYDSNFDGEEHDIDICCTCYKKWIETFTIKPTK